MGRSRPISASMRTLPRPRVDTAAVSACRHTHSVSGASSGITSGAVSTSIRTMAISPGCPGSDTISMVQCPCGMPAAAG